MAGRRGNDLGPESSVEHLQVSGGSKSLKEKRPGRGRNIFISEITKGCRGLKNKGVSPSAQRKRKKLTSRKIQRTRPYEEKDLFLTLGGREKVDEPSSSYTASTATLKSPEGGVTETISGGQ